MDAPRNRSPASLTLALLFGVLASSLIPGSVQAQQHLPPLTLRSGFGTGAQGIDFPLSGTSIGADTLRITPNTPLYLVAALAWRSVGAAVSFTLPGTLDAIDERGVSDFSNIQLQLYRRRLAVDLAFQRHTGMYLSNADEITTGVTTQQLPSIELQTLGATVLWTRNRRLNLTAAYRLNQLPERSGIGLVWMGAASRVRMDAPGGPGAGVPALAGTIWSDDMRVESYSLIAGPGLAAIGDIGPVFLAPLISLGFGTQYTRYTEATESGTEWNIAPQLSVRLSAGYNAPRWFWGIIFLGDVRNVQTPYLEANQTSWRLDLMVGRRYRMLRWKGTRDIDY